VELDEIALHSMGSVTFLTPALKSGKVVEKARQQEWAGMRSRNGGV